MQQRAAGKAGVMVGRLGRGLLLLVGSSLLLFSRRPASAADSCSGVGQRYRPLGLLRDYTLGRTWRVFSNCGHPEMPRVAVDSWPSVDARSGFPLTATGGLDSAPPTAQPAPALASRVGDAATFFLERPVEAGRRVRLWKRDGKVRIELTGVALEGGSPGVRVRVRVTPGGQVLSGRVRGTQSVELVGALGFSGAVR